MIKMREGGVILKALPNTQFIIGLKNGEEIRAYLSGKMNKNKIKAVIGDKVTVEFYPDILYKFQIGRIVFRK